MGRVVLVTGVAGELGFRLAARLAEQSEVDRVVGVDVVPPRRGLGPIQFVRADIRNPVIAKVILREQVDTVVHMSVIASSGDGVSRANLKELNVIGTMQLLAACQQAPTLRHLVVKSSSVVYGATSRDPAKFTEEMSAKRLPAGGYAKDVTDVEGYVRSFARRRPDVRVTTLRMANVIGPNMRSAVTAYFRLPVIPTVFGFDARLQFLHEDDSRDVLVRAALADVPGTFNVAGDGILLMSQAVRRLGRPSVALPSFALSGLGSAVRQARFANLTQEQVSFLTYGRCLDTHRMSTILGFEPAHTTAEAFAAFASSMRPGLLNADRVGGVERVLRRSLTPGATTSGIPDSTPARVPAGSAPGGELGG